MERSMSVEEKIRRAEEIYARRQEGNIRTSTTVKVNESNKKDIKLLKKMIRQIIICIAIYLVIYTIQNSNYMFSEEIIGRTKEILSYDTNFMEIYETMKHGIIQIKDKVENFNKKPEEEQEKEGEQVKEEEPNEQEGNQMDAIGGAVENTEGQKEEPVKLSQEEQDIEHTKETTSFIKPIEGMISSPYGYREPTTDAVPKNHTGTDIAANVGTKIKAATDGEVVLASEEGDYGKHLKIQIGEVSIIYAHCNDLYVKQGDKITQGQEIAEVGSTGNSTGPHLHFEIRYQERILDPQKILAL